MSCCASKPGLPRLNPSTYRSSCARCGQLPSSNISGRLDCHPLTSGGRRAKRNLFRDDGDVTEDPASEGYVSPLMRPLQPWDPMHSVVSTPHALSTRAQGGSTPNYSMRPIAASPPLHNDFTDLSGSMGVRPQLQPMRPVALSPLQCPHCPNLILIEKIMLSRQHFITCRDCHTRQLYRPRIS